MDDKEEQSEEIRSVRVGQKEDDEPEIGRTGET